MSLSPTNILAKLDVLKKWQQKQQERLLNQHHKRLEHNNTVVEDHYDYEKDYPMEQIEEECVSEIENEEPAKHQDNHVNTKSKPKRPFLRRGAGLARFRMAPGQQLKPFTKSPRYYRPTFYKNNRTDVTDKHVDTKKNVDKPIKVQKPNINKNKPTNTNQSSSNKHNVHFSDENKLAAGDINTEKPADDQIDKPVITPLKRPDLNIQPKAVWHASSDVPSVVPSALNSLVVNNTEVNESSDRELLIFEALEQRAMQSSFCSTNSSIVRLLSSTPSKSPPAKAKNSADIVYAYQRQTDDGVMQNFERYNKPIQEIADETEDYSKVVEENTQTLHDIEEFEKQIQDEYLSLIEKALKFKQYVAGEKTAYSSASSVTSEDVETTYDDTLQTDANFNDKNKWTTASSSSSPNGSQIWDNRELKCNAETMTETIVDDNSNPLLQNKVKELEKELKSIHAENIQTSKLKAQLEQQRKEFEKHRKEILKQVEEERIKISTTLEEERKKLAKEKMVFERYVKDLQNKPSRKEREEIAVLKTEIATLTETLKLKETKNGMAQARLRNQIKNLEKENSSLKAEIENLNKQNAKLVVSQKLNRKPSDTKMLHEINRNLTKLAKKQLTSKSKLNKEASSSSDEDSIEVEKPAVVKSAKTNRSTISPTRRVSNELVEKENDKNLTNTHDDSVEEHYKREFGLKNHELQQRNSNSFEEIKKSDRTEEILSNGTKQIKYTNGNVKTISADGNHIILKYYNGDVKETNLLEGMVRYHYYESGVNHTTYADGTELIEFPDGQTEKRLKGGITEVQYSNGIVRKTGDDGTEEISYPDGTSVTINTQGDRILLLPNGQKEIHTNEHKRREYPDGTVKILYPDGLQETRYANGRIRLKDKNGKLLMDSQNSNN